MKSIIVPLDGSATAEMALEPAAALATGFDADLVLVMSTVGNDRLVDEAYLRSVISGRGLRHASARVVAGRSAAAAIADEADARPDPVICMSTHGRSGWRSAVFGSVAHEVVRWVPGPVVLVGPRCRPFEPTGKVVVCCDGSDSSRRGIGLAATWARALGSTVQLLTVGTPAIERGEERPADAAAILAELQVVDPAATHVEVVGDAAPAIVAYLEDHAVALAMIASHGTGGRGIGGLGSVARHLVAHSPRPVVLIRAH